MTLVWRQPNQNVRIKSPTGRTALSRPFQACDLNVQLVLQSAVKQMLQQRSGQGIVCDSLFWRKILGNSSVHHTSINTSPITEDKACPRRNISIPRDLHQVRPSIRPLENNHATSAHHTSRNNKLVIWSTDPQAPNLVHASVHLIHELERPTIQDLEDRDRIATRINGRPGVTVRCVDVWSREVGVYVEVGNEDLASGPSGVGEVVGRDDGELGDYV